MNSNNMSELPEKLNHEAHEGKKREERGPRAWELSTFSFFVFPS
jgi:hypothetical protein